MQVIYIAPLKAIVRERMIDWKKRIVSQLGKEMVMFFTLTMHRSRKHLVWGLIFCFQVEMTGDYTPDLMALMAADIIISTPEKWDGISRNWHNRDYVKKVQLSFFLIFIFLLPFLLRNCLYIISSPINDSFWLKLNL